MVGTVFEVEPCKKRTRLWREALLEVKMVKLHIFGPGFGGSRGVYCGKGNRFCTLSKVSQTCGFCSSFKMMAGVGRLKTFLEEVS